MTKRSENHLAAMKVQGERCARWRARNTPKGFRKCPLCRRFRTESSFVGTTLVRNSYLRKTCSICRGLNGYVIERLTGDKWLRVEWTEAYTPSGAPKRLKTASDRTVFETEELARSVSLAQGFRVSSEGKAWRIRAVREWPNRR